MADLRYPIGDFEWIAPQNDEQMAKLVALARIGIRELVEAQKRVVKLT